MAEMLGGVSHTGQRDVPFDAASSRDRVRMVQDLCSSLELDAIVVIPGVDGRRNDGAGPLINFLFFGTSGSELTRVSSTQHEQMDDMLLTITPTSVHMFCPPPVRPLVESCTGLWANLQVYTLTEEENDDTDLAEDEKVCSFVKMTAPYKRIGIPLPGTPIEHVMKGDAEIEKWPVVQAYAFDDMGNGAQRGFFTMNHTLCSVHEQLVEQCYQPVDAYQLRKILDQSLPLLRYLSLIHI
eukprot:TRINITY_DN2295_c0_g1_i2.p1 TRINITY_DN2295_c0_g1~~TRINITY_DN2295_c0_g1_i2.p1  ORF type:complete len:239 (+),score=47.86 TRINITY_DN2295_c0_g1_i2:180-896(+)